MSEVFEDIQQSQNDKRLYRHITLPNKLEVMLVHDAETEKCSAACDVRVGAMSDPKDVQGLAHFLEHMLFMGTEKYPEENAYSAYLNAHGGYSNAYTAQEDTVYYFDVQSAYFEGALDMFASFFWCPLFDESSTAREMTAVDNENTKNLQSDMWRNFQLVKSLAKDDHPYGMFSTGNLETLQSIPQQQGINIRERLLAFHKQYYSANVMKLVVYGSQDLNTLQSWVEEKFSPIENKGLAYPSFPPNPYSVEQLGHYVEIVPVKDIKSLLLYFPMPPTTEHFRTKPVDYLSHLIGHESEGSILSVLKARGWANGLASMLYQAATNFSCFAIDVTLTDVGTEHVADVAAVVFEYIGLLRKEGPQEWVAKEVKDVHDMNFRFISKSEPSDYAVRVAEAMHLYPKDLVLSGDKLVFDLDLSKVGTFLEYLRPSNALVLVIHKGLAGKTSLKEKWYGTPYNYRPVDVPEMQRWEACVTGGVSGVTSPTTQLTLPIPNPFMPTDFTVHSVDSGWSSIHERSLQTGPVVIDLETSVDDRTKGCYDVPVDTTDSGVSLGDSSLIAANATDGDNASGCGNTESAEDADGDEVEEEDPSMTSPENGGTLPPAYGQHRRTWFRQDTKWLVPKANVSVKLQSLYAYSSPLNVALCDMFANVLKEALNEFSYYADCAGLYYDISNTNVGLELSVSGYHDKLPVLLSKIITQMKHMDDTTPELFQRVKEKVLRGYFNSLFTQPYNHCVTSTFVCLEEPRWTNPEKHRALSATSLVDFTSFAANLIRAMAAEVFVHGNISPQDAKILSVSVTNELGCATLSSEMQPYRRAVMLDADVEYIHRMHTVQFNPNEQNSAIENVYFIGDTIGGSCADIVISPTNKHTPDAPLKSHVHSNDISSWSSLAINATLELLEHVMSEPFFDQLRTKEQLGYLVYASGTRVGMQCGMRFIIQSNSKDPVYMDSRIETFIQSYFDEQLVSMSEQQLQDNKSAVIENLLEKPKNTNQEAKRLWGEISNSTYFFTRREMYAEYVATISLEDLVLFYQTFILESSRKRRKFSSQFFGSSTKFPAPVSSESDVNSGRGRRKVIISDPSIFKRQSALRPVVSFDDDLPVVDVPN